MTKPSHSNLLLSLLCAAPLLILIIVTGPLPDSDRAAHSLWAGQLVREGSLSISPDGVVDDWRAFYPNTVPKPGDLFLGVAGILSGQFIEGIVWFGFAWAVIFGAMRAAGGRMAGALTGVFLGVNPVFLNLSITRSPAVPFLALLFLGTSSNSSAAFALSSLVRPEGFIFGVWKALRKKSCPAILIMALSAGLWALVNTLACGDLFWSGREVRYCVSAMGYETPNVVTYLPWLLLRAVAVLGPLPLAALLSRASGWELRRPVLLNLLFLWAGLLFGGLVLPRYADQVLLLAVPFAMGAVLDSFRGKSRVAAVALCLAGAALPWADTIDSWRTEMALDQDLRAVSALLPDGMIAANELVVPRLAILDSGRGFPERYVALDRAVWEGAGENDLLAHGVTAIVIFRDDFYLSDHAEAWVKTLSGRIPLFDISPRWSL
ncbi:MAG: hypothetical protein R6V62_07675 [Candidatus Fermentibacteraceae bacterium]